MKITRMILIHSLILSVMVFFSSFSHAKQGGDYLMFVGTYAANSDPGIYVYRLDSRKGSLHLLREVSGCKNPSFLAIAPSHEFLYAVNESGQYKDRDSGAVTAFALDKSTGALAYLNEQPSHGRGPCHVTVDRSGRWVLCANYGGGSAAAFPIFEDGKLGKASSVVRHEGSSVHPRRQTKAYAHSINLSPDNRYAYVADLGMDKTMIYRFDDKAGTLEANEPSHFASFPGSGPRHFTFHPNGRLAFLIEELRCTVTAMRYDAASGGLARVQTISTLPLSFDRSNTCADIHVHPNGRFVYGSNRGHDSIVIYAVDPETGRLSFVGHESVRGIRPRNFNIDPTGSYLFAANQVTDNIVTFEINQETGALRPTNQAVSVPNPVCIQFMPMAK
ncbi:beta-propeller fold lactonase family protein [bacterium]|nr:beta-propeller fold lactonase family protein [bacterium]